MEDSVVKRVNKLMPTWSKWSKGMFGALMVMCAFCGTVKLEGASLAGFKTVVPTGALRCKFKVLMHVIIWLLV